MTAWIRPGLVVVSTWCARSVVRRLTGCCPLWATCALGCLACCVDGSGLMGPVWSRYLLRRCGGMARLSMRAGWGWAGIVAGLAYSVTWGACVWGGRGVCHCMSLVACGAFGVGSRCTKCAAGISRRVDLAVLRLLRCGSLTVAGSRWYVAQATFCWWSGLMRAARMVGSGGAAATVRRMVRRARAEYDAWTRVHAEPAVGTECGVAVSSVGCPPMLASVMLGATVMDLHPLVGPRWLYWWNGHRRWHVASPGWLVPLHTRAGGCG